MKLPVVKDCNGCGACCTEMGCPPFVESEIDALPPELKLSVRNYQNVHGWDGGYPCLWYDAETQKCSHYEHRPEICRDFQPGSAACHLWRHSRFVADLTFEQWDHVRELADKEE